MQSCVYKWSDNWEVSLLFGINCLLYCCNNISLNGNEPMNLEDIFVDLRTFISLLFGNLQTENITLFLPIIFLSFECMFRVQQNFHVFHKYHQNVVILVTTRIQQPTGVVAKPFFASSLGHFSNSMISFYTSKTLSSQLSRRPRYNQKPGVPEIWVCLSFNIFWTVSDFFMFGFSSL